MTFAEVERLLGFYLPPSARRHAAWWSNNVGTNVAVKAWRNAGWKTSRVDIPGERVTFVRERADPRPLIGSHAEAPARDDAIVIPLAALDAASLKLLRETAGDQGDLRKAAVALLQECVLARRKALLEWFATHSPVTTSNSVDLIREGREERDGE